MTFVTEPFAETLAPEARGEYDRLSREWMVLRESIVPFIGERATTLFSYAIADTNGYGATREHFREVLTQTGENPDESNVTEAEQLLIDWGRQIASDPLAISAEFRLRLERTFTPHLRVLLAAFAAQLVAAILFLTIMDAASQTSDSR